MNVQIGEHTLRRAEERGTNLAEIEEVLETGSSIPAKYGRMAKAKVFEYRKERNDVYYEQKRVEVYYVMEGDATVTVTVYVFYGKWEEQCESRI
jgi:hypothetical protein